MKVAWVYILDSEKQAMLYVFVTSNLITRIHEHKANLVAGFT